MRCYPLRDAGFAPMMNPVRPSARSPHDIRSYRRNGPLTAPSSGAGRMPTAGQAADSEQHHMETHEPTTANADLWAKYFQEEWGRWFRPFGATGQTPVAQVAEGTAARVASFLSLVAAGPIAWLYS